MDSDQGKLFIGGISWETSEEKLKEYFSKYGEVVQTVVMKDKLTGKPRGFGFVAFADPSILDRVLQDKHNIDGRTVEAKRAMSREEQQSSARLGTISSGRSGSGVGHVRTKKIFVGGLPPTLTEEGFRQYFETYGQVTDVVVMYDQATQRPRGFGFISFDSEDAVDRVLEKTFHELNGKQVEVKHALPKDASSTSSSRSGAAGAYSGYSSSGVNTGAYDNRLDANRYSGFTPYGQSGYPTAGYGYGGTYGAGGYAGPGGTFVGVPPVPPRSPWNSQALSAYGSARYGSGSGYGGASPWIAPGLGAGGGGPSGGGHGGAVSVPMGQPTGPAGGPIYGYNPNEGSYLNPSSYESARTAGGRNTNLGVGSAEQRGASGSGYMRNAYGDGGGSGYQSSNWRPDLSHHGISAVNGLPGGQASYAAGYRNPQNRSN